MIDVWCTGCDARVLLGPSRLEGIVNTTRGPLVVYRCYDGHRGAEVVERRPADA